ncbi:hypothetical protein ACIPY6_28610 [Streptomyces sp. NPDC090054]|uniref:hypothetical protein n=1 Tax=Streptomyces sp. NPDC090054 TaxID=3365933 RepID=UPI003826B8F9
MTTHTMRPAVALAWVLGLTLFFTRPEIAAAAVATLNWTLTTHAGAWILGVAFIVAITFVIRGTRGWTG